MSKSTDAAPPQPTAETARSSGSARGSLLEVLLVSTKLGLTSFGGPIAHLGYFHREYVEQRRWLTPEAYAETVALSQALPGPASSQVGIAVGLMRAGPLGALLAWLGFTLPSAIALTIFAFVVRDIGDVSDTAWVHGLKLSAVAVVAFAVWGMARNLAADRDRATIAAGAAVLALSWETAIAQVAIIVLAAVVGRLLFFEPGAGRPEPHLRVPLHRKAVIAAWVLFFLLLGGLPIAAAAFDTQSLALFDRFYRAGSLVFGGGHVVLPLLERGVVDPGWLTQDQFLAGYGAAQAVPGPLFTLSAYLGAVAGPEPNGVPGAAIALVAIFLPSFLLIFGGLPLWSLLMRNPSFHAGLRGINAAVVGLLLAALYDPVWTSAVKTSSDFSLALVGLGLLAFWKAPPLLVVALTVIGAVLVDLA